MRPVAAVILAAGGSTRLGRPKQLLLYKGSTLVRRIADAALVAGCEEVVVVLGAAADSVRGALDSLPLRFIENAAWATGMGSSIACAIGALDAECAALVVTCDQPFVTGEHLGKLVLLYQRGVSAIVASEYKHTLGVPALFAPSIFPELLALDPSAGAKAVLRRDPDRVAAVPLEKGEIDIDTEADYAALML
jgi:molybdenum cofactor cytidylyltransferase